MPEGFELAVVVPVFNEENILEKNLSFFANACDRIIGAGRWHYVIVDNGSTDTTPAIIDRLLERWPGSIKVLEPEPNYGKALKAGLRQVTTPWAKTIDVDWWDVPFLAWSWSVKDDHDLLIGSKRADPTLNAQRPYRVFLSWGLNSLIQLFFRFPGSDTHGPKLLRMSTMKPILNVCTLARGQFDAEFVLRALRKGLWVCEAPVICREQRPSRNLMVSKILWNVIAFNRLRLILRETSYEDFVKLRRFARPDVLQATPEDLRDDRSGRPV